MDALDAHGMSGTSRAVLWGDVPDEEWNDWRWQLSHRLDSLEELQKIVKLTDEEKEGILAKERFRLAIPPYFASLIDPDDPNCPIRRQVIPTSLELKNSDSMMIDALDEDHHSPVKGLVHRYPDRVLMLVTMECASYCRHCTRSRMVGNAAACTSRDYDAQIDYIARTPQVRDVLISGGDPLVLNQRVLEDLLTRLRAIPHVEILRIGTRTPCYLPQRIDESLVSMLRRFHPLWMNIHFNHPKEITPEARRACEMLADAGIPLGCQTVLLAGINDCPNIIKKLCHELVKIRVRPYYLYQCDLVAGTGHFHTPVSKGLEIMEAMRGHTSGLTVPTYTIDAPGGGGKIPLTPNYLLSMSESKVVLRNFEGYISTYTQPTNYKSHDPSTCEYCRNAEVEPGQRGIAGLLSGEQLAIRPEGFEASHLRMTSKQEK